MSNILPIDPGIGQAMHHVASALAPLTLDRELRERLRSRVIARVRAGTQPEGTRTLRAHEGCWATFAPGVSIKLLRADTETARMTALIRMQPGSALPGHRHEQAEECLVLEGELFIGRHRLDAGDLHVASLGTDHQPISSPTGALMLVHAHLSADLIG